MSAEVNQLQVFFILSLITNVNTIYTSHIQYDTTNSYHLFLACVIRL